MSNQNKTTIKKTLLLTATMVSFGFLSTAHSADPELTTDEVVENVDVVTEDATELDIDTSITTEDTADATTDDLEDAKDADDDSAEEEGKCGGQ